MAALLVPLIGCDKPSGDPASAPVPAALPPSWPIAELKLPAGAMSHPIPYYRDTKKPGGMKGVEKVYPADANMAPAIQALLSGGIDQWEACFTSTLTWSEITSHVEGSLLPLGYIKLMEKQGSVPSKAFNVVAYLSSNRKLIVFIMEAELPLDDGKGTSVAFTYTAYLMPIPVPQDKIDEIKRTGRFYNPQ